MVFSARKYEYHLEKKMTYCVYCLDSLGVEDVIQGHKYSMCANCNSLTLLTEQKPIYDSEYYSLSTGIFSLNIIEKQLFHIPEWLAYRIYPIISGFTQKGFGPWYCNKSKKILDFGAGDGALVRYLNSHYGQFCKFYDPYYQGTDEAHLDSPFQQKEKFDVIVISHVIEHLDDLNDELEKFHRLLSEPGILVIRVPVRTLFWTDWLRNHWRQLDPPYHRSIPTVKGVNSALKRNGYIVKKVISDSNDLSWRSLFSFAIPKYVLYAIRLMQGLLNIMRLSDQKTFIVSKK